jgi:hypothetical protein
LPYSVNDSAKNKSLWLPGKNTFVMFAERLLRYKLSYFYGFWILSQKLYFMSQRIDLKKYRNRAQSRSLTLFFMSFSLFSTLVVFSTGAIFCLSRSEKVLARKKWAMSRVGRRSISPN